MSDREDDDLTRPIEDEGDLTRPLDTSSDETRGIADPEGMGAAETRHLAPAGHDVTSRTEVIRGPQRPPELAPWLIATVAAIALIIGAAVGFAQRRPAETDVVARAVVGTEGGVVTFDTSGRLEIGSGALSTATSITIRRTTVDRRVQLGAEADPDAVVFEPGELVVYVFEPADLRFRQPVTVALPRQGGAAAVLIDTPAGARVIPGEVRGDTVRIETTSFAFDS